MGTSWDEAKRRANVSKHGVDFVDAEQIFVGPTVETQDRRRDHGEARFQALGQVHGLVFYVVYTWRNGRRRIITARRASSDEVDIYRTIAGPAAGNSAK